MGSAQTTPLSKRIDCLKCRGYTRAKPPLQEKVTTRSRREITRKSSQMRTRYQERSKIVRIDSATLATSTTSSRSYPHRRRDGRSPCRVTLNEVVGQTIIHAISASIHSSIMAAIISQTAAALNVEHPNGSLPVPPSQAYNLLLPARPLQIINIIVETFLSMRFPITIARRTPTGEFRFGRVYVLRAV